MARCELAELTLFKWNENLIKNNVPSHEGLLLFIVCDRDPDGKPCGSRKMKVINFNKFEFLNQWPYACHGVVRQAVEDAGPFFEPSMVEALSVEISERITTCYYLSTAMLLGYPRAPCFVIAAQVTRTIEYCIGGRPLVPWPPDSSNLASTTSTTSLDIEICSSRDQVVLALFANHVHRGNGRDNEYIPDDGHDFQEYGHMDLDDDDDSDTEDVDSHDEDDHHHQQQHSDLDQHGHDPDEDDFGGIVGVLRSWRGVDRTYPLEPLCAGLPAGLILVQHNLNMAALAGVKRDGGKSGTSLDDGCAICLDDYHDDVNEMNVVIRTDCGHVFHINCIFKWLGKGMESCPMCRSSLVTRV